MSERFVAQDSDIRIRPRRTVVVRDVNNWKEMGAGAPLYAVVMNGRLGPDFYLSSRLISIPASPFREIDDVEGVPSLIFGSAELEIRNAQMEDVHGVQSAALEEYRPHIPYAPIFHGEIELGPERIL